MQNHERAKEKKPNSSQGEKKGCKHPSPTDAAYNGDNSVPSSPAVKALVTMSVKDRSVGSGLASVKSNFSWVAVLCTLL